MKRQFLLVLQTSTIIRKLLLHFTGDRSNTITLEDISVVEDKLNGEDVIETNDFYFRDLSQYSGTENKFQKGSYQISSEEELLELLTEYAVNIEAESFKVYEVEQDINSGEPLPVLIYPPVEEEEVEEEEV